MKGTCVFPQIFGAKFNFRVKVTNCLYTVGWDSVAAKVILAKMNFHAM